MSSSTDKQSGLSRRLAMQGLAAGASLALTPCALAQGARHSTPEDFKRLMKELSNWNRWGASDEMGAVNLITPARRRQAAALVREGVSFSMARNAETQAAVDNPNPIVRKTLRSGKDAPSVGSGGTGDNFFIAYHGYVHTHLDSLSHFLWDGKMYNGHSKDEVTEEGAAKNAVLNYKNGILTRGVLMDMARYKGVEYLEPGTPIYPEDLEGWERRAGVKVRSGDAMLVRTGRWARREARGPWSIQQDGLAGLHMSCAKWMRARDVAILGGDGAQDVLPSGVAGINQPIHLLSIVAMGMPIFDNCDLELIGREAEKRKRWEFLVTASPAAVPGGTGSVLNPIATF
ncbi:MAG: cyclase family protein [Pseudomonadota bacterium]